MPVVAVCVSRNTCYCHFAAYVRSLKIREHYVGITQSGERGKADSKLKGGGWFSAGRIIRHAMVGRSAVCGRCLTVLDELSNDGRLLLSSFISSLRRTMLTHLSWTCKAPVRLLQPTVLCFDYAHHQLQPMPELPAQIDDFPLARQASRGLSVKKTVKETAHDAFGHQKSACMDSKKRE